MSSCASFSLDETILNIKEMLDSKAEEYSINLDCKTSTPSKFRYLIEQMAKQSKLNQIVLLIDEYDKPIIEKLGQSEVVEVQTFLKQFYSVIKATEKYLRFSMLTGVSKFSKVSIFSDLNNLRDLTMSTIANEICGYTHAEVKDNFAENIDALAAKYNISADEAFERLVQMYVGYKFSKNCPQMFNPVSIASCFSNRDFRNY